MEFKLQDFIENAKSEDGNVDYEKANKDLNEKFNKQANDLIAKKQEEAKSKAINGFLEENGLESADDLKGLFDTKNSYEETKKELESIQKEKEQISSEKENLHKRNTLLQKGYGFNDPDELDFVQLKVDKRLKDSDKDFDTIVSEISEEMPPQKLSKYSTPRNKGSEKTEQSSGFEDYFKKKYNK